MATYDVTFNTLDDTSARGGRRGPAYRRFTGIEAKSAKRAIEAAYIKLMRIVAEGYCKVDDVLGVTGSVERDTYRGAALTRTAGYRDTFGVRRGGQFSQPTWEFTLRMLTGPLRLDIEMRKVQ